MMDKKHTYHVNPPNQKTKWHKDFKLTRPTEDAAIGIPINTVMTWWDWEMEELLKLELKGNRNE